MDENGGSVWNGYEEQVSIEVPIIFSLSLSLSYVICVHYCLLCYVPCSFSAVEWCRGGTTKRESM